jgi:putative transposase
VGAARFAWNWGLARVKEALERDERIPTAAELHRAWNGWKREGAPWWREVSKCAPQEALRDLERALRRWRAGRAGFPRFKRKKVEADNGCRLTGRIRVEDARHVRLPRIGRVRTKERTTKLLGLLREGKARILSATIRREADRWYVSLTCEVERPDPTPAEGPVVGVDLGLKDFAVISDGACIERVPAPKPLGRYLGLLRRRSRGLARKQARLYEDPERPGRCLPSRNYIKAALRLSRLHRRIRNIRMDFFHKLTTALAKTKRAVVVEDLRVRNLGRNGHLARAIGDVGWGTFRRLLEYKTAWYGSRLIVVPAVFPSTRRCSKCGRVRAEALPLRERTFRCEACGYAADRDENAARNLYSYGLAALKGPTGSSPGSEACGAGPCGGTVPAGRSTSTPATKQEGVRG